MPRRRTTTRYGFTLLELMIVIGIIAILAGLGFVAFGAIRGSQEERNSKATLEIARSMYNSFVSAATVGGNSLTRGADGKDTSYYLRLAPQRWAFNLTAYAADPTHVEFREFQKVNNDGTPFAPNLFAYAKQIDYYNVPRRNGDVADAEMLPMNVPTKPVTQDAVDWVADPGTKIGDPLDPQRWQLYATMLTIRRLRGSPEAKAIWSTLRDSQIKHVDFGPPAKKESGDFVLDAWGHPLLFVPGTGLRGLRYGTGPLDTGKPTPWVNGDPTSSPFASFRSPDGKSFWASAGPDGYYDTQDDNIYSFNN